MGEISQYVLLKDGSMLKCTVAQKEKINQLIMMSHDFEHREVKLDGHIFKLGDLETDVNKLANALQQGLPMDKSNKGY